MLYLKDGTHDLKAHQFIPNIETNRLELCTSTNKAHYIDWMHEKADHQSYRQ